MVVRDELYLKHEGLEASYIRIDGSVPSAERIQLVHRFQNDPDTRVAILSIQAAGQGLTLTAASHVVFAELYWNPGHVKQAEDRAHRIGQTSSVHVHYLIAKGTFDMVMWGMLNRKERVTGSTLNGRKDYLKAEEGDKEKWDFLNFAQAWTPSDSAIGDEDDKEGVFFSHFEKDKQHDIRNFFSPTTCKDRKRKRPGDSSAASSPLTPSHDQLGASQSPHNLSPGSAGQEEDFCPQVKRLKQASPLSRRSSGKKSPLTPLSAPRLSAGLQVPRHSQKWSCGVCTFSNSGLLLRCEMCETPRSQIGTHTHMHTQSVFSVTLPCITLPDSEDDQATPEASGDRPIAITPQTPLTKQSQLPKEDGEERSTFSLQESQTDPSTGNLNTHWHSRSVVYPRHNDGSGCSVVDDSLPVYDSLKFCASKNTDRIYIYNQDGLPLNCNFIPLDIRLQNWEDLPPEFRRTENRKHVVRFVREWSFLTAMKQRMVRKSGRVFSNPILLLDELTHTQRRHSSTKRQEHARLSADGYLSKQEVAQNIPQCCPETRVEPYESSAVIRSAAVALPYQTVILQLLSGDSLHGGSTEAAEELLWQVDSPQEKRGDVFGASLTMCNVFSYHAERHPYIEMYSEYGPAKSLFSSVLLGWLPPLVRFRWGQQVSESERMRERERVGEREN
ncbi:hypothetical protein NFI96_025405, partial [Prochilodus magdalenae]